MDLGDTDDFNVVGRDNDEPLSLLQESARFDDGIGGEPLLTIDQGGGGGRSLEEEARRALSDENLVRLRAEWMEHRKRKADTVAVDPLDFYLRSDFSSSNEERQKAKKAREDEAGLNRLVERIEMARLQKLLTNTDHHSVDENGDDEEEGKKKNSNGKRVFTVPPANAGNWMAVSSPDAERRFYVLAQRSWEQPSLSSSSVGRSDRRLASLFGRNYKDLLQQAELILTNKEREKAQAELLQQTETDNKENRKNKEGGGELLVEKYKPKHFIDLLSDDGINRTLLTWLKLWDECVFGKKVAVREVQEQSEKQGEQLMRFGREPAWKKKRRYPNRVDPDELPTELDQFKRPQHKVTLLCGPPGLGKTTLAHIIAKHAGYHVVEMNASDERNMECFQVGIEKATQFKATLDADPRPNCLIIDEIDGAPAPSINYLVSLLKGEATTGTGKAKRKQIVKRPVICICNDLYASALRELRKVALVLQFPVTNSQRLVERLQQVCRREAIQSDQHTLELLCEKTSLDIRACLNTIQFSSKPVPNQTGPANTNRFTTSDVQSSAVGLKDAHKSLFAVWQQIFQMPRLQTKKRGAMENPHDMSFRFNLIHQAVMACGDDEKVLQGIFENYLNMNVRDSRMNTTATTTDWFGFADRVTTLINRTQVYDVMPYLSYIPVVFHFAFANAGPQAVIQFPFSAFDNAQKLQRAENILVSLLDAVDPSVRQFGDRSSLVQETLPQLADIIQPHLRPVNSQLYSGKERAELTHVVDIMLQYNLTYRQDRNDQGQYAYVLEPAIEQLIQFPDEKNRKQFSYSAKQMIAREVEVEKMRRIDKNLKEPKGPAAPVSEPVQPQPAKKATPNHLQKLTPKPVMDVERPTKSYFSQPLTAVQQKAEAEKKKGCESGGIWFKFNEGYSNAIRRNIRMRDLL